LVASLFHPWWVGRTGWQLTMVNVGGITIDDAALAFSIPTSRDEVSAPFGSVHQFAIKPQVSRSSQRTMAWVSLMCR